MSQFYDQASLVMVPSGYKDGKLYSQKPLSTSGELTFSRGSDIEATRVNSQGLIEKAKVNLVLQSNQFDTTWAAVNTTLTSGQGGYDGSSDAWLLSKAASAGNIQLSVSTSGVHTFSYYAKAGSVNWTRLLILGTANASTYINLTNGAIGIGGGGFIDATATSVGGGWYRVTITHSTAITQVRIYPADDDDDTSGTSGNIYIQDAQLNYGLVAQDYVETTTAAVVTGITNDMPRLSYDPANPTCPSLLLEPSRQNLYSYSEYAGGFGTSNTGVSIEENATTSPEGVVNAAKIKEDGTNASHAVRQLTGPTLTSGTEYTFSFFAKKGERTIVALSNTVGASNDVNCFFDLENGQVLTNTFNSASIEDFGNGWWRCIATDTADAADDYDTRIYTATADNQFTHQGVSGSGLYIFGIQLEAGSYATSYIPTYGTSATRTKDICGGANNASLYNDSEGVLFVEMSTLTNDGHDEEFRYLISDGTNNERIQMGLTTSNSLYGSVITGNVGISTLTYQFDDSADNHKIAIKYSLTGSDFSMWVDGVEVDTDTIASAPSGLDRFDFYRYASNNNYVQGNVRQVIVFPIALTDAQMAELTA